MKRQYYNEKLADFVLNLTDLHKIMEVDGKLIRKMEPVYHYPSSGNGRAHFFASVKRIGGAYVPTLLFNVCAIWLMNLVLYLAVQFSLLAKAIELAGDIRRKIRQLP